MENVEKIWKKRENDGFMEIERRELRFESGKIEISVRNMMVIVGYRHEQRHTTGKSLRSSMKNGDLTRFCPCFSNR